MTGCSGAALKRGATTDRTDGPNADAPQRLLRTLIKHVLPRWRVNREDSSPPSLESSFLVVLLRSSSWFILRIHPRLRILPVFFHFGKKYRALKFYRVGLRTNFVIPRNGIFSKSIFNTFAAGDFGARPLPTKAACIFQTRLQLKATEFCYLNRCKYMQYIASSYYMFINP